VFEAIIRSVTSSGSKPIVVAAAGNTDPSDPERGELAFPARFGAVVSIGSINSRGELSSFSRYGNRDHGKREHRRRFVLPGGDAGTVQESIGVLGGKEAQYGTSIAAAYGSGCIAQLLAQHGVETLITGEIWNLLREQANRKTLAQDDSVKYGCGLLTLA
jgi:subtilisin family serine protease